MRLTLPATILLSLAFLTPAFSARPAQSQDATAVLAAARVALGGKALDGVRSFTATGSSVIRVLESTVSWRSLEISVELPDKFLRVSRRVYDEPNGAEVMTEYQGFNGSALIDSDRLPAVFASASMSAMVLPSVPLPRPDETEFPAERRLRQYKYLFLRLMLPLFAAAPAGIPLQVESGGRSLVGGRLTDCVVLKTIDDIRFRLYVDAATRLPLKLAWTASRISRHEMESGTPSVTMPAVGSRAVEWAVTLSDYKTEGGVTWPRRLITWVGDRQFEDVRLRGYKINVPVSARTFDPRR